MQWQCAFSFYVMEEKEEEEKQNQKQKQKQEQKAIGEVKGEGTKNLQMDPVLTETRKKQTNDK